MNTKVIFAGGGGSNLILGIGTENQLFFLRTVKFLSQNCQKMTFWCKKKFTTQPDAFCIAYIGSPTLFPRRIIIFQGVLTKFFHEISKSGKICHFHEGPKI